MTDEHIDVDAPSTANTLRALADWLDAHPTANGSVDLSMGHGRILDYQSNRDEFVDRAREIGGRWEKDISDTYFFMRQEIVPGVSYQLYTSRAIVCERVVVGTEEVEIPDPDALAAVPTVTETREVVEWRCPESLLDAPAVFVDGSRDGMTRSLDVIADSLAAPGGDTA